MTKILLSVDPGKHGCGIALFGFEPSAKPPNDTIKLLSAAFVPQKHVDGTSASTDTSLMPSFLSGPSAWVSLALAVESQCKAVGYPCPDVVVVETMKIYTTGHAKPSDIMNLQAISAAISSRFPNARHLGLEPSKWKGQVPRQVLGERVEKKVLDRGWFESVARPKKKTELNDVHHAIGLGLYALEHAAF